MCKIEIDWLIHSFTDWPTYSFIHSFIHSLTHSLTHSFVRSFMTMQIKKTPKYSWLHYFESTEKLKREQPQVYAMLIW